ncbi:MAG: hypothetical protein Q9191_007356 [Dirinaria sp. TL-2023a]
MDPLSVAASVIAVASLAAKTASVFNDLRLSCKTLPGRLHALSNEVSDLELVLRQVASLVERRADHPILRDQQWHIPQLMKQAQTKLGELRTIVQKLCKICQETKIPLLNVHAWRKDQPKLHELQDDIRTVKCSLNIMLGASNSNDMMRIRLDLQTISTVTSQSVQDRDIMRKDLETSLVRHHESLEDSLAMVYQRVDQRISSVEQLLKDQSMQLQADQFSQMGPFYRHRSPSPRREPRMSGPAPPASKSEGSRAVGVRVSQYSTCRAGCPCACHKPSKAATPGLLDRIVGQIFVGYAGLPLLGAKCDTRTCEKAQSPAVSFEYWFPMSFVWSQILQLKVAYEPNVGPQFELRSLRRVADSAQCVHFALNGNIEGLKGLFRRGLASPRDVSNTRGYSLLRWAMYGKQYQTCKFLVHAGADVDYRPIAVSDNSPRHKANQFLLMGGLSEKDEEALRCVTQESDFVDEQNYTILHKIVLGLSLLDLEEEILRRPEEINTPDVMGRTPLAWAACRGDERAIVTLLQHRAKVNTIDVQYSGIVGHAADRNYVTCVRLLLEAGADPDIAAAHGHKVGNPLNVAARNAKNPLILKTLLDFRADKESCGVDGMTALIHSARRDNASFAFLLLEAGANINATSVTGETPLTTAIAYNSHNVLQLLLDRWFEYSECPRLKGPNLLQICALYGDLETMAILAATDHLSLKYDNDYILGDFRTRLNARPDATDDLSQAFEDLLIVVQRRPPVRQNSEKLMESGLLSPMVPNLQDIIEGIDKSDTEGSDQEFENALESLEKCPANQ